MDEDINAGSKPRVRCAHTRTCPMCGKIFKPETLLQKSCTECYEKRKKNWIIKENDKTNNKTI